MSTYVTIAGYQVDAGLLAKADAASRHHGVPVNVTRAIILCESGFRLDAHGDRGRSRGLLNLYMDGGQGTGYTTDHLDDPDNNLAIGMPYIAAAWRNTSSLAGAERVRRTAALSGHPGDPTRMDHGHARMEAERNIERIVDTWRALEGEQPEPPAAQFAGVLPVVEGERINEIIDRSVTWVREHPREAAVAAGGVLVAILLV